MWHSGRVRTRTTSQRWVLLALAVYALAAVILLLSPVGPGEIVAAIAAWMRESLGWSEFREGWIEVPANVLLFVPLGLLLALLFRPPWIGVVLAVALSVAAEAVQLVLPGRLASPRDILANALGAGIGAFIAWLIIRRRRPVRPTATTRAR